MERWTGDIWRGKGSSGVSTQSFHYVSCTDVSDRTYNKLVLVKAVLFSSSMADIQHRSSILREVENNILGNRNFTALSFYRSKMSNIKAPPRPGGKRADAKELLSLDEKMTAAETAAMHERQIVATTFANMELANTKQALAQYMELYDMAKRENEALTKDLKERDLDSLQVLEYLRLELAQKTQKLDDVERNLRAQNECRDALLQETTSRFTAQLKEKDDQLSASNQMIAKLQKDLEDLSLFSRERQEILHEMDRAKEDHQAMINKYERELTKLRFQTIEEKVKLKAAETEMVKKFNAEVDARATILVDVKAKSIHENNKNLVHDKGLLEKEVSDLVTLATEVQSELKEAQRSAALDVRIQQEAMRHTAKLNKVARESDAKAQILEQRCQHMQADFDSMMQRERNDRTVEVAALTCRNEELEKALGYHRNELLKVRKLAATIVNQRSDLEHFFYDALADVRHMKSKTAAKSIDDAETNVAVSVDSAAVRSHRSDRRIAGSSPRFPRIPPTAPISDSQANWFKSLTGRQGGHSLSSTPMEGSKGVAALSRGTPVLGLDGLGLIQTSSSRQVASSPRDMEMKASIRAKQHSGPRGGSDHRTIFTTSAGTGDPEEVTPLPTLREDNRDGDMPRRPSNELPHDGIAFGELSWPEKELVIQSLLYYINQSYYQMRSVSEEAQSLPSQLPSQIVSRQGSAVTVSRPLAISNTPSEVPPHHQQPVPPLPPRAPKPASRPSSKQVSFPVDGPTKAPVTPL